MAGGRSGRAELCARITRPPRRLAVRVLCAVRTGTAATAVLYLQRWIVRLGGWPGTGTKAAPGVCTRQHSPPPRTAAVLGGQPSNWSSANLKSARTVPSAGVRVRRRRTSPRARFAAAKTREVESHDVVAGRRGRPASILDQAGCIGRCRTVAKWRDVVSQLPARRPEQRTKQRGRPLRLLPPRTRTPQPFQNTRPPVENATPSDTPLDSDPAGQRALGPRTRSKPENAWSRQR